MMRALWTAATGMEAQQRRVDVIANNLANVSTDGFKKTHTSFEDLIYQNLRKAGTTSGDSMVPTGIQVGHGVKHAATQKIFSQGNFEQTENPTDLVIQGKGFFQITDLNGETRYTRAGSFKIDGNGELVTNNGFKFEPGITIPENTVDITISPDGVFSASDADNNVTEFQIQLARFVNPAGLEAIGDNLFAETTASGTPTVANPGDDAMGTLQQGFLESSNVKVVEEMVNLIEGQRAYESNSKSIQTADSMLSTAVQLKR